MIIIAAVLVSCGRRAGGAAAQSTKSAAAGVSGQGQTSQNTAQPAENTAQPSQNTAQPAENTAQPSQNAAQASENNAQTSQNAAQASENNAQPSQNAAQLSESGAGETADSKEQSLSPQEELAQELEDGYEILTDVRDTLYSYYSDKDIPNNEEIARGIVLADELISRISKMDRNSVKPSQVAAVYDEMSDIMDIFTAINPEQDPRSIDILQMREDLKGSMWIDDDINTYIFDRDGKTMYIALAGDDEPSGGTYTVTFTDEAIRFTFSIPELTTEVKGDVTEFSGRGFRFTDVNTGDEFYLTPVER